MCLTCLYDAPVVSSGLEHTTGSTDGKKNPKQNKTAGCDQTPTAYPRDETQKPRNQLNSQQALAVHEHGVAD